jgi:hypothetical protein
MNPVAYLPINWGALASAFALDAGLLKRLSQDGRFLSKPLELSLAHAFGLRINTNSNGSFDVECPDFGMKYEVRLVTLSGTNITPSRMRGAGRSFDLPRFVRWVSSLHGFYFIDCVGTSWSSGDTELFPVYKVSRECAMSWFQGLPSPHLSAAKFQQLISAL